MNIAEQTQIARSILTDNVHRGINSEFIIEQYKALRKEGVSIIPSAIMSQYTRNGLGHQNLVPKILKHFNHYFEKIGSEVAAAYLAVIASEYESPNPIYYNERQARVLESFNGLEGKLN